MLFKLTRWYFKCITVQKLTSINKTGLGQRFSKCGPWTSNGIRIARGLIRNAKSQNQTQTYWVSRSEGGAQETMFQYTSGDSDVRFVWGPLVNGQSKRFAQINWWCRWKMGNKFWMKMNYSWVTVRADLQKTSRESRCMPGWDPTSTIGQGIRCASVYSGTKGTGTVS